MIKKLLVKIWLYFKYPNKLREDIIKCISHGKAKRLGLQTFPPNYIYLDVFNKDSNIIDIGCGFKAEFSCHLIEKYGLRAFGVDPTRKHKEFLQKIESKYKGNFRHVEVAISKSNAELTFYETQENESGSLLTDHQNILNDTVVSYPVVSKNIQSLLADLEVSHADLLKIDIEGAEYELFENFAPETLHNVGQIFIEFHHHAIKKYHRKHTKDIVKRIKQAGFSSFTRDGNNYLFFLPGLKSKP